MAADLAASHLIDFIVFLAPQVGLEPTTLRLTAEWLRPDPPLDVVQDPNIDMPVQSQLSGVHDPLP